MHLRTKRKKNTVDRTLKYKLKCQIRTKIEFSADK